MATTVTDTTNPVSQSLLDSVNGKKNKTTSDVDKVQDRFMKLLVTQMKNQDPLNPMDNAQVTSQMAQLSTVSGIDKLNTTVESLMSSVNLAQSYQATNMIGHNVLALGNTINTTGNGGDFGIDLPTGADKVTVTIKDSAGNTVRTLNLGKQPTGTVPLNWDGRTEDGSVAKNGSYKFEVSATTAGDSVKVDSLSSAQVKSVSNSGTNLKLNLSNSTSISLADIRQIF